MIDAELARPSRGRPAGSRLLLGLALGAALAGCGSVPSTTFYTLVPAAASASPAAPVRAEAALETSPLSLSIGPVSVPEAVDRPQFVVRTGAHEQRLLDQSRWTQSLPREIDSALIAHLGQLLPGARLTSPGQSAAADARWRLAIDVQRFDAEPARQTVFEAIWSLRDRSGRLLDSGRFVDQRPVAVGGFDALAASQAASVEVLARTLADRLRRLPVDTTGANAGR